MHAKHGEGRWGEGRDRGSLTLQKPSVADAVAKVARRVRKRSISGSSAR